MNRIKWRYCNFKKSSKEDFTVHLLVVKNTKYSELARVCIESFYYYHPLCSVIVHCDKSTYYQTEEILRIVIKRGTTQVILDQIDDQRTWQEQKIQLIISMNGTNDVFLDADLRWNGSIPIRKGLTFFVEEFSLIEKSPYKEMLSLPEFSSFSNPMMRNTSFFSFAGIEIEEARLLDISTIQVLINNATKTKSIALLDRSDILRISEQLAISLAAEKWGKDIYALKSHDRHRDGEFVESSYFGVTGVSF